MLVFVYGTLKKGGKNHRFLNGAEFVCEDLILGRMWDTGLRYPKVSLLTGAQSPTFVKGEVWDVDEKTLQYLDILEGVHWGNYRRATVHTLERKKRVYVYVATVNEYFHPSQRIVSGFWPV